MLILFKILINNLLIVNFLIFFLQLCDTKYEENGHILTYDNFEEYKNDLNKTYAQQFMEIRCRKAYEENCKKIREHNAEYKNGKYSFQIRANCLADLVTKKKKQFFYYNFF